ncbi:hypothetical protein B0A49_09936 [Cryomyces minteri]|uniref:Aminoglycoside phosphotransferase domain-containing protein n=1 Tax=Cryomyces minteri TaxID=331657 RepID=A0A4U0WMX6_9PEZI|nr:hypothetical protein B0A49_09936 [Cryomyces minteri]
MTRLKRQQKHFGPETDSHDFVNLSEAASLEFIRRHTSAPVPKVYCAFERHGQTYIVMERIKGHKLADGWSERSEKSRTCILAQLRRILEEIRSIPSTHGSAVASVDGGSLYDMRLPGLGLGYPKQTPLRFGPFDDIPAFHRWLRRPASTVADHFGPEVNELINLHEQTDWGSPVFTHGDMTSLNVLVQGDSVVGIVDWETAGWYPSYWEFTTASQVTFRNGLLAQYIDSFLEPRWDELRMERIRLKYFGDN